jgi:hypothetical protein
MDLVSFHRKFLGVSSHTPEAMFVTTVQEELYKEFRSFRGISFREKNVELRTAAVMMALAQLTPGAKDKAIILTIKPYVPWVEEGLRDITRQIFRSRTKERLGLPRAREACRIAADVLSRVAISSDFLAPGIQEPPNWTAVGIHKDAPGLPSWLASKICSESWINLDNLV